MSQSHRALLSCVLALLPAACNSPTAPGAPAAESRPARSTGSGTLLPAPRGPLDLAPSAGKNLTLHDLLARLSQLTGVTYSGSPRVTQLLQGSSVSLSQSTQVPATEAYAWVEALLAQHGFVLCLQGSGTPALVGVYSRNEPHQTLSAFLLETEALDECRVHPATMFTVTLTLPHVDVRTLGNSLRILSPNSPSGGVIPVGTTHSVILEGTGSEVAKLAGLLYEIEEKAQAPEPDAPPPAAPGKP